MVSRLCSGLRRWTRAGAPRLRIACAAFVLGLVALSAPAWAQPAGSIRGVVYDADFNVPLAGATVRVNETEREVTTTDQGNYVIPNVSPGEYTLVITKQGYQRQVETVTVAGGQVAAVDARLSGDFTEMDEFVVRELRLDAGSEQALLRLRSDSPALLDSIGEDLMSRAGAGDAAEGLKLVSGATTTAEGFAAVRGLPPRFVSTQLNGFSLPSANPDSRAVRLGLFPSDVIESIQVSKTFTPDQQGDASGGAVNIVTKSIPDENFLAFSAGTSINSQRPSSGEFLEDARGEVGFFASDSGRDLANELTGLLDAGDVPVGRSPLGPTEFGSPSPQFGEAPIQGSWGVTGGLEHEFGDDVSIGGLATFFWDQSISHDDDRVDNSLVARAGALDEGLQPDVTSSDALGFANPDPGNLLGGGEDILTSMFDETRSQHEVEWGGLGTFGLESDHHELDLMFFHTRSTSSTVTIAEDTRSKFRKFPGHDPTAINTPGGANDPASGDDLRAFAPFRRVETQQYIERTVQSFQLDGRHTAPWFDEGVGVDGLFTLQAPAFDWHLGFSESQREEPGTTFFDSKFSPPSGFQNASQTFVDPGLPDLGAFNVIFRDIVEESEEYRLNFSQPFEQWTDTEGEVKVGVFDNQTTRDFEQNTFKGGTPATGSDLRLEASFDQARLSQAFANPDAFQGQFFSNPFFGTSDEPGNLAPAPIDFIVDGRQDIEAKYWMLDLPLTSFLRVIGGMRYESTRLSTQLTPDGNVDGVLIDAKVLEERGIPTGNTNSLSFLQNNGISLDSEIDQTDELPSAAVVVTPIDGLDIRGAYSETVARPTFRELTPISQSLFAGETPFVGNPFLEMSAVENYDLRVDYRPSEGSLFSVSYFKKDVEDPIQVIQQGQATTNLNLPVNFPSGEITGWEVEVRQQLGEWVPRLEGLTVGGNATFLDTQVSLREFEAQRLAAVGAPQETIPMTNAPEYLYNLFMTYDVEDLGTQLSLFYTVRGDTLIASPGVEGFTTGGGANFLIPGLYETAHGTLNLTVNQEIGEHVNLSFSAENLTNPEIETVHRSEFIPGGDVVQSRHSEGIDFSFGISADFRF